MLSSHEKRALCGRPGFFGFDECSCPLRRGSMFTQTALLMLEEKSLPTSPIPRVRAHNGTSSSLYSAGIKKDLRLCWLGDSISEVVQLADF